MFRFFLSLLLFAGLYNQTQACQCVPPDLQEEIEDADLIFKGIPIEKRQENFKMIYRFAVRKTWKGQAVDTLEIQTGLGGGDCGMLFYIGKAYIVFAKNGRTSRCRMNRLAEKNKALEAKLDLFFSPAFSSIFKNNNPRLSSAESAYLNSQFPQIGYDFSGKSVAFTLNLHIIPKGEWFRDNFFKKNVVVQPVLLNETEKAKTGYDIILVSWSKRDINKRRKKKLLEQLEKKEK